MSDSPTKGPTTEAILSVPPMTPVKRLLFLSGTVSAMIMKHPLNTPPQPIPIVSRKPSQQRNFEEDIIN